MREYLELRINYDFAHLLFGVDEGHNVGTSVRVVRLTKDDPRYNQIPIVSAQVKKRFNRGFFFAWEFIRKYNKLELEKASFLHLIIKSVFEPSGEECGTVYDEAVACDICGANGKQIGPLVLRRYSIPKKDIAKTIAGEVVVSEKFMSAFLKRGLKGILFSPVKFGNENSRYYQLFPSEKIELSANTLVGVNPFDFSEGSDAFEHTIPGGYTFKSNKEIYKCPKGDTIGLNHLSEPHLLNSPLIKNYDFLASKQMLGVRRGLLRPEPLYFCSQEFKKMVDEEKLIGFDFEIARVET